MENNYSITESDKEYMRMAIAEAVIAKGHTNPNPMVGAVIVKDGKILAKGCHERYGDLHAERNALSKLKEDATGADMYVTLEPCCHTGKQPPCTEAVVASGVKRVFIGSRDPNPLVSGKGVKFLEEHGIEVYQDVLREECDSINRIFFHYITTKTPYIVMKYAMTLDGKIATRTGKSKWISSENSRELVARYRGECMGILVGIGTVLADDPMLTARYEGARNPIRIVVDSHLRISEDSKLVATASDVPVIVACLKNQDNDKRLRLIDKGVDILEIDSDGKVDLKELFRLLGQRGIDSILVEGGGTINESVIGSGLADELRVFIAPKVFGGEGKSPVMGLGVDEVSEAKEFKLSEVSMIDEDILLVYVKEGEVCSQE